MKTKTLLILGAGGHGRAVAEAALLSKQWESIVFADDCYPDISDVAGYPVVSTIKGIFSLDIPIAGAIAAVGNNTLREQWISTIIEAKLPLVSVIHPRACVSPSARVGEGSAIMALAMVGVDVRIGRGAILNANATVDHDAILGDFSHLGVGVQLAGGVKIGASVWLQAGCCAGYNINVPDGGVFPPGTSLIHP